ncbi:MAG: hypothetical protein JSS63_10655 [Bacteroidetes bacterium]|nr:hypothetical protein [Bacteroidota bacterium]
MHKNVEKKIPSSLMFLQKILENFNILKDDDEILNEIKPYNLPAGDNIILNTSIKK